MSEGNGVIRLGRKGRKKFAIGEDGPEFEIDVIQVNNQWIRLHNEFYGHEPPRKMTSQESQEYENAVWRFVKEVANDQSLSLGEALEFVAVLNEEADKLKGFFVRRSSDAPNSPASSDRVVFSE